VGEDSRQQPHLRISELKQRMKAVWMAGDFGKVAPLMQHEADVFVERLGLKPGMKVLDVGCGRGNQSIPAAKTGAEVTGVDMREPSKRD
jgi:2-polyprenyl-3-methyl-5-hydroxy-6-metoxy-1,4-benzoquinol methylase